MVFVTNRDPFWYRPGCLKYVEYDNDNKCRKLKGQYKSRFCLIIEQVMASLWALIWLGKLRMCLQVSNELHGDF